MNTEKQKINSLEKAFEEGDDELLQKLLPPLLEKNVPEAIRINACFSSSDISEEEKNRLYVDGMFKAVELGDLKAKYYVGVMYDYGQYGVEQNKQKASEIFKYLAEQGHPHSQWIHACELIWGKGSFAKETGRGLKLLQKAADNGSAEACITLAKFYDAGEFGYEQNIEMRDYYRKKAIELDDTTHDPFS